MVWSEHDSNFYQLMRIIEREKVELDWRQSKGHTLGTGQGPSRRLLPIVEKMAKEKEKPVVEIVEVEEESPTLNHGDMDTDLKKDSTLESMEVETGVEEAKKKEVKESVTPKPAGKREEEKSEVVAKESAQKEEILGGADPSTLPTPTEEQQREVQGAIENVVARNEDSSARNALQTVLKLTRNVLKHPDNKKYRHVAMNNKTFHTKVSNVLLPRQAYGRIHVVH